MDSGWTWNGLGMDLEWTWNGLSWHELAMDLDGLIMGLVGGMALDSTSTWTGLGLDLGWPGLNFGIVAFGIDVGLGTNLFATGRAPPCEKINFAMTTPRTLVVLG